MGDWGKGKEAVGGEGAAQKRKRRQERQPPALSTWRPRGAKRRAEGKGKGGGKVGGGEGLREGGQGRGAKGR